MNFRTPEGVQQDLYLLPRQLVLFSGEARYNYLHSIATRKLDKVDGLLKFRHRRISLTFRKLRESGKPCTCRFPKLCDSQSTQVAVEQNKIAGDESEEAKVNPDNLDASTATDMEKKHVYEVYEKIAPHFSNTRYKPWPRIQKYLEALPLGSLNCDVGCGNGKYLGANKRQIFNIGTDRSHNLLSICKERDQGFQTFFCDSLKLPVRSGIFDSVISIAVIHHFSTPSLRVAALSEMHRILKVGGRLLVYVWAYEQ
jgi:alkylated DNA repair protein alkB family protein 8